MKYTTETYIQKAQEIHKNKYNYSQTVYTKMKNEIKIICSIHGVFVQRADYHINGGGCPKCGKIEHNKKVSMNTETFIVKL